MALFLQLTTVVLLTLLLLQGQGYVMMEDENDVNVHVDMAQQQQQQQLTNQEAANVVTCRADQPVTIATLNVVVDAEHSRNSGYRVAMVTEVAEFIRINPNALRLLPKSLRNVKTHKSNSVLASGGGNCKNELNSIDVDNKKDFKHFQLEWTVGCGHVTVDYLTSLQRAEKLATAPQLSSLWHCVDSWQVANNKKPCQPNCNKDTVNLATDRFRRAIRRAMSSDVEGSGFDGPLNIIQQAPKVADTQPAPTTTISAEQAPPVVKNFLRLIVVRIGDVLNFTIPSDTFVDETDGDTRQLKLELREENGRPLPAKMWIKFDSRRQIIYALPKSEHEGRHAFLLRASDSNGNTAVERVRVKVMPQRRDQRDGRVPVEYSIAIKADFHQFTSDVENMAWLVTRLAAAAGDRSATSVSLTRVQGGSVIVSWVNNTLSTNRCPSDDIKAVLDRFVSPVDGQISGNVISALQPYKPLRFFTQPMAACLEDDAIAAELTVDTAHDLDPSAPEEGDGDIDEGDTDAGVDDVVINSRPLVNQPIGTLHVTVGAVLDYVIPEMTFVDAEDGNTRQLRLIFLSLDNLTVSRNSWVRLNAADQRLYGLALTTPPGTYTYQLAAADSQGQFAHHRFDIVVRERTFEPNHEFTVVLKFDFAQFMADVARQVDVAKKLAQLYGDTDASHVTVLGIAPDQQQQPNPALIFTWANTTLAQQVTCPVRDISRLWSSLVSSRAPTNLDPDLDSKASEPLIKILHPYEAERIELQVLGPCENAPIGLLQSTTSLTPPAANSPSGGSDAVAVSASDDGAVVMQPSNNGHVLMDTKAVAASVSILAIFVIIVIIVIIVIAVYFRRRQRHKYPVTEHKSAVKVKHGAPIIFADELEASLQAYGAGAGGERPPGTLPRALSPSKVTVAGVSEGAGAGEEVVKVTAPVIPAPPDYPRWGRTSSGGMGTMTSSMSDHKTPLLAGDSSRDSQAATAVAFDNMSSSFSSAN